jgi:hypothetical protein
VCTSFLYGVLLIDKKLLEKEEEEEEGTEGVN